MALSIKKVAEKILASKEFAEGSPQDQLRILIEFGFVVFDATRIRASKTYGRSKWYNSVHISNELKNISPPDNMFFDIN